MPERVVGLMPRQLACMQVIQELMDETGVCPSFREIAREMDLKSIGGVHRLVQGLMERGYLDHRPRQMRGLVIWRRVPMPDFTTPQFVMSADLAGSVGQ
jgi:repressor LexA